MIDKWDELLHRYNIEKLGGRLTDQFQITTWRTEDDELEFIAWRKALFHSSKHGVWEKIAHTKTISKALLLIEWDVFAHDG